MSRPRGQNVYAFLDLISRSHEVRSEKPCLPTGTPTTHVNKRKEIFPIFSTKAPWSSQRGTKMAHCCNPTSILIKGFQRSFGIRLNILRDVWIRGCIRHLFTKSGRKKKNRLLHIHQFLIRRPSEKFCGLNFNLRRLRNAGEVQMLLREPSFQPESWLMRATMWRIAFVVYWKAKQYVTSM